MHQPTFYLTSILSTQGQVMETVVSGQDMRFLQSRSSGREGTGRRQRTQVEQRERCSMVMHSFVRDKLGLLLDSHRISCDHTATRATAPCLSWTDLRQARQLVGRLL